MMRTLEKGCRSHQGCEDKPIGEGRSQGTDTDGKVL